MERFSNHMSNRLEQQKFQQEQQINCKVFGVHLGLWQNWAIFTIIFNHTGQCNQLVDNN